MNKTTRQQIQLLLFSKKISKNNRKKMKKSNKKNKWNLFKKNKKIKWFLALNLMRKSLNK